MPGVANIGALTTQGIRAEFALAFQPRYRAIMGIINECIWETTSDKLQEVYGVLDSATYPVRWGAGNTIPSKGFSSSQLTVQNRDFGRRVYLPRNWEDDQTGQVFNVARQLGQRWATLSERIFFQFIQASTDPDLLPAVPNSIDGNSLYAATARYGSASGNVVTQTGSTTVQQIITDAYSVRRRFLEFQDTESQPFFDSADVGSMRVFHGPSLELVVRQARYQTRPASVIGTAGAAVTNIALEDAGMEFAWTSNQRVTNTRLYYFLRGIPGDQRPLLRQVRKGMNEAQGNWATSDHTRDTGQPYVQFDSREGWGSINARSTIRVS